MVDVVILSDDDDAALPTNSNHPIIIPTNTPHTGRTGCTLNDALFNSLIKTLRKIWSAANMHPMQNSLEPINDFWARWHSDEYLQSEVFREHILNCQKDLTASNAARKLIKFHIELAKVISEKSLRELEPERNTSAPLCPQRKLCVKTFKKRFFGLRSTSGLSCPVCLDSKSQILASNRNMVSTKCGHIFCSACIVEVTRTNKRCPTCRQSVACSHCYHNIYI